MHLSAILWIWIQVYPIHLPGIIWIWTSCILSPDSNKPRKCGLAESCVPEMAQLEFELTTLRLKVVRSTMYDLSFVAVYLLRVLYQTPSVPLVLKCHI